MEGQIAQTEQLKKEIERQSEDNEEILKQIQQDADDEQKEIESKNAQNVKQVNEMSLKSKAELQLTNTKLVDLGTEIDQLTSSSGQVASTRPPKRRRKEAQGQDQIQRYRDCRERQHDR